MNIDQSCIVQDILKIGIDVQYRDNITQTFFNFLFIFPLENPSIITIDKLNRHSCNKCYRGILWDASILKTHAVCLTQSFINQSSPRLQAFVIPKIIIIALSLINTVDLKECLVVKKNECLHNCSIYYILT